MKIEYYMKNEVKKYEVSLPVSGHFTRINNHKSHKGFTEKCQW